jgi:hypothetical protein
MPARMCLRLRRRVSKQMFATIINPMVMDSSSVWSRSARRSISTTLRNSAAKAPPEAIVAQ